MATYKVIQDIEAEDKLLGPLSLRQFIYAVMVIVIGVIGFQLGKLNLFLAIPFLPPMAFFGLLAAPFGQNQSSEIWLLAKIRFFLKPRKRIWDQTGMKELVTITAPKKIEHALTNGLSQTEVKSRLQALANTIDSRGWAVKNVNVNLSNPAFAAYDGGVATDRLVSPSLLPQEVVNNDIYAADDIMDGQNNASAQALDAMLAQSTQAHRQAALATVQASATTQTAAQGQGQTTPANYWFMNQPDPSAVPAGQVAFGSAQSFTPGTAVTNQANDKGEAEQALLQKIHAEKAKHKSREDGHKIIKHVSDQRAAVHKDTAAPKTVQKTEVEEVAPAPLDPRLLDLAGSNNLSVSTIAHEAADTTKPLSGSDGEVVISLR